MWIFLPLCFHGGYYAEWWVESGAINETYVSAGPVHGEVVVVTAHSPMIATPAGMQVFMQPQRVSRCITRSLSKHRPSKMAASARKTTMAAPEIQRNLWYWWRSLNRRASRTGRKRRKSPQCRKQEGGYSFLSEESFKLKPSQTCSSQVTTGT